MFKKIILVYMCLIILVSCGRKNDPKYELSSNEKVMNLEVSINVLDILEKDEI